MFITQYKVNKNQIGLLQGIRFWNNAILAGIVNKALNKDFVPKIS